MNNDSFTQMIFTGDLKVKIIEILQVLLQKCDTITGNGNSHSQDFRRITYHVYRLRCCACKIINFAIVFWPTLVHTLWALRLK